MTDFTPTSLAPSAAPPAWASLLRSALIAGGGVLVTRGYLDSATLNAAVGALLIILPAAWGIWQKIDANAKLRAAIAAPAGKAS